MESQLLKEGVVVLFLYIANHVDFLCSFLLPFAHFCYNDNYE
ncbi:hypothetical protein SITYG_07410 [Streptococcus intermedius]|uniref:Uncharacterized protein n=1 Tax=Streptococcus intermedius TaxID=1338 RepID=A0AAD1FJM3_STRIT|nr:hypothetical protein SITYG_07410 [Streptococcus intermedius]